MFRGMEATISSGRPASGQFIGETNTKGIVFEDITGLSDRIMFICFSGMEAGSARTLLMWRLTCGIDAPHDQLAWCHLKRRNMSCGPLEAC